MPSEDRSTRVGALRFLTVLQQRAAAVNGVVGDTECDAE